MDVLYKVVPQHDAKIVVILAALVAFEEPFFERSDLVEFLEPLPERKEFLYWAALRKQIRRFVSVALYAVRSIIFANCVPLGVRGFMHICYCYWHPFPASDAIRRSCSDMPVLDAVTFLNSAGKFPTLQEHPLFLNQLVRLPFVIHTVEQCR